MEGTFRRYPIGIQSFERLRNDNCVYIDKTELIYRLANSAKACFLSRPRRFGKSLLVSTLAAYFSGKKDLFKGLMMEQLEKDWTVYPVLHPLSTIAWWNGNEFTDVTRAKTLSVSV